MTIVMVDPKRLRHIEGHSKRRVAWLKNKVLSEGVWTKPLAIEKKHFLAMDGQHRMEVALALGLARVPCELFSYEEVEVWSLRDNYEVSAQLVIERSLSGDLYPYKTAKHRFPRELSEISIPLADLRRPAGKGGAGTKKAATTAAKKKAVKKAVKKKSAPEKAAAPKSVAKKRAAKPTKKKAAPTAARKTK